LEVGKCRKPPVYKEAFFNKFSGGDLLSRGLAPRVPSALEGLTSVFEMGTGVAPPPYPPEIKMQEDRCQKQDVRSKRYKIF
jgi:hypothetical protein